MIQFPHIDLFPLFKEIISFMGLSVLFIELTKYDLTLLPLKHPGEYQCI